MSDSTSDRVTYDDVAAAGLDDWRMLVTGIHARFSTGSFAAGVRLVDAIGAAADDADHHPDVTLTYPRVDVSLVSHDVGRVTDRDLALARRISEIAAEQGVASDPSDRRSSSSWGSTFPTSGASCRSGATCWPSRAAPRRAASATRTVGCPGCRSRAPAATSPGSAGTSTSGCPATRCRRASTRWSRVGDTWSRSTPSTSFWVLEDKEGNRSCICTAQGR